MWAKKADLPLARWDHALVALNGALYAIGGYSGSTLSSVARYDPAGGSWSSAASLLTARREFAAGAVDGKIYVACGMDYTDPNHVSYVSTTEQYDPAANQWTAGRAACPAGAAFNNVYGNVHIGGAAANGKLYLAVFNTNSSPPTQLFEYDPAADRWTAKAAPPFSNSIYALTESSGALYLLATTFAGSTPVSALARYDAASNAWVILPSLSRRWWSALTSLNGKLYAIGGADVAGTSGSSPPASTRVDSYDPQLAAWADAGRLQVARNFAAPATLGTQMYVAGGASSGTSDVAVPLSSMESGQLVQ
ncbi:MAG TPA: kelch repeat-containing protein [Myxococcales bacterium]|nr:kelch repeat-containing protein [Myxococcales bacterium]